MSGSQATSSAGMSHRLDYIDAMRVALIILVVSHHAVEPYANQPAPEALFSDEPIYGLWSFLWVNAAFFMGFFFFLAGIFMPRSYDRKGFRSFVSDRAMVAPKRQS